jgi:hypothetical protein
VAPQRGRFLPGAAVSCPQLAAPAEGIVRQLVGHDLAVAFAGEGSAGAPLAAGTFSDWVAAMQGALEGGSGTEVPCGDCSACCTSSQFVHIGPEETDSLAHIPPALLFPAPRLPAGHVLLGYDQRGHCPMLVDDQCSIYEHRPRACRTYDCRVFAAAGVDPDDGDGVKVEIGRRADRWRFAQPTQADRARHDAVRAAAAFLDRHHDLLPSGTAPVTRTQLAVLAVEVHEAFLRVDSAGLIALADPEPGAIHDEVLRRRPPPGR